MADAFDKQTGADAPDITPWDDPNVKAALKSGRDPSDIMLIDCPNCGVEGYYNQGSHFRCRECGCSYNCITEDEEPPETGAYIVLGEEYPLSDWDGSNHEG